MKGWDPAGELGPKNPLPDMVQITEPPVDKVFAEPTSEQRGPGAEQQTVIAPPAAEEYGAGQPDTYGGGEPAYQEPATVEESAY